MPRWAEVSIPTIVSVTAGSSAPAGATSTMSKLFISYRRDDSADVTGRLHDRLKSQFGDEAVFLDVDAIPLGVDFRMSLTDAVNQCDVLLAVIGDHWLDASF